MKIVLCQPEIPGNTGTIGRTCVGLDMELILIQPYGFELSEKSVRRAGLDYWKYVRLTEYDDWEAFIAARTPRADQLFLFENDRAQSAYEVDFPQDAYLVFGRETTGLSPEII
ncbi:MAG: tRNA (uridine(34)/cytosine(34)/5-carboxymethylaminomethyluridine(34)-2'-O)-methyltransferase TrmL, partial [Rhodobacteraceae bacterium]|nr:tRNA (uridine(34)/cytosine(34)/5-carboxymethylaminomethyluridine(34)-2'-O)-methyltransferase TrmL [Paracoccaceae bacterium]